MTFPDYTPRTFPDNKICRGLSKWPNPERVNTKIITRNKQNGKTNFPIHWASMLKNREYFRTIQ